MGQRQTKQILALGQTITHHQHANPAPSHAPISFVAASGLKPRPAIPPPTPPPVAQPSQHGPAPTTPTEVEDLTQALAALTIQPTTPQKRKHAPPDPVCQTKKRRKLSGPVALPGSRIRGTSPHRTSIPSFPRSLLPRRTAYIPSTFLRRVTMPLARRYAVEMDLDPPQPVVVLYRWPGDERGRGAVEGQQRRQHGLGDYCERELLLLPNPWVDEGEEILGGGGESGACQDETTELERAELERAELERAELERAELEREIVEMMRQFVQGAQE